MILFGKSLADEIKLELKSRPLPKGEFVIVKVGSDPVSKIYISKKMQFAEELHVKVRLIETDEEKILEVVKSLNEDDHVRAIMVQLPLPDSVNRTSLIKNIDMNKDVDGFHYILDTKGANVIPPTVKAILELIKFYKISLSGGVLIVGGGFLVGRPLKKFLLQRNIKAEILGKDDPEYDRKLMAAEVVVVATGAGNIFDGSEFKDGATVIDASTVASEEKISGDIKLSNNSKINLAPVPGGVGPVTVAMLYKNFYDL